MRIGMHDAAMGEEAVAGLRGERGHAKAWTPNGEGFPADSGDDRRWLLDLKFENFRFEIGNRPGDSRAECAERRAEVGGEIQANETRIPRLGCIPSSLSGQPLQVISPFPAPRTPRLRVTFPRPDAGSVPSSNRFAKGRVFVRFYARKTGFARIARFSFLGA